MDLRLRAAHCVLACQVLFPDMAIIVNCLLQGRPLTSVLLFIQLFISNYCIFVTKCDFPGHVLLQTDYLLSCNLSAAAVFIVTYCMFKAPPRSVKITTSMLQ